MTSSSLFAASIAIDDRRTLAHEFYEARFVHPDVRADPYPHYREMRELAPVLRSGSGFWIVTGYAEARRAIHGPSISSRPAHLRQPSAAQAAWRLQERFMIFLDGSEHSAIRKIAHAAMKRLQAPELAATIESLVDEHLHELRTTGAMDVVATIASALPPEVMMRILGVPAEHRDQLRWCTEQIMLSFDPVMAGKSLGSVERATHIVLKVLGEIVARRRVAPEDDLMSALVASDLSYRDVIATAIFFVIAGYETSTSMIANGTMSLLHTGALRRLHDEPGLVRTAVEEVLRYESPIQFVNRTATEPIELGGAEIGAGDELLIGIGAANRDEVAFADPDCFDVAREENPHLAFALGSHYCMGAHLARLEGATVFAALAAEFPDLRLVERRPSWRRTINFRTVKRLPVRA